MPRLPLALLLLGVALPPHLGAQEGWNTPRALDLVARARALRQAASLDATFQSYRADARGFVYFYLDREDTDERVLVKTDQVALEVYWKAPDSTRQRIVGLRDEKTLPTNIRYHLDHLTVVQDEFADVIRLGDGDEVAAVTHPVAPDAEAVYDYHLADSITLSYGGGSEIRVYEIEVKPKDLDAPGFLGSLFVSRDNAAIVRMSFTFTPSSYVDEYLDYIRISLDNSVWDERWWLPYEQRVELRREVPFLDFPAGSVIRGRYEIRNYEFDPDLDPLLFRGPRVTALPEAARRAFDFEEPLHARLDEEGLGTLPDLAEVRAQAVRLAGRQAISGLAPNRLWIPSASSVLRYNRGEGLAVGLGASLQPTDALTLRVHGGWSLGRERPTATLRLEAPGPGLVADAYLGRLRDVGPLPAASGVINTLGGLLADQDWLDPYGAAGVALRWQPAPPGTPARPWVALRWERQRSLVNTTTGSPDGALGAGLGRAVRPIREGDAVLVETGVTWSPRPDFTLDPTVTLGRLDGTTYGTVLLRGEARREWVERGIRLGVEGTAGWASAEAPPQSLFLLGGRSTLPGYVYRSFLGDRLWLVRTEASRTLRTPWVRVGGTFALGGTGLGPHEVPAGWQAAPTDVPTASAGLFAELLWDLLRVDLSRGLNGGSWALEVGVQRRFHPWL